MITIPHEVTSFLHNYKDTLLNWTRYGDHMAQSQYNKVHLDLLGGKVGEQCGTRIVDHSPIPVSSIIKKKGIFDPTLSDADRLLVFFAHRNNPHRITELFAYFPNMPYATVSARLSFIFKYLGAEGGLGIMGRELRNHRAQYYYYNNAPDLFNMKTIDRVIEIYRYLYYLGECPATRKRLGGVETQLYAFNKTKGDNTMGATKRSKVIDTNAVKMAKPKESKQKELTPFVDIVRGRVQDLLNAMSAAIADEQTIPEEWIDELYDHNEYILDRV